MKTNFSINAKACTLFVNDEQENILINESSKFEIPIYQRPYSWGEHEISQFLRDLFLNFMGTEGDTSIEPEPMFIGTMQLSGKEDNGVQKIIDGQQRLTTILLLIKCLSLRYKENKELKKINYDILTTKVNNGTQNAYLQETFRIDNLSENPENENNPYLINLKLIDESLEEYLSNEDADISINIDNFISYLCSKVYFVVITTTAGLSKTLQIFNAINTTGLDLNGGDIFKIRFFEYLTKVENKDESIFDEISHLYERIDAYNKKLGRYAENIGGILDIYKYVLIARYGLNKSLHQLATDTFFERLFDTLLNVELWDDFSKKTAIVKLSIEDLEQIIDSRYVWETNKYITAENGCSMHFIWWSRYGRYWKLIYVFLYVYRNDKQAWEKLMLFITQLSKVYFIYSVRFLKSINYVHTYTYNLIETLLNDDFDKLMKLINTELNIDKHKNWHDLEHILAGEITDNAKKKNLICRLSAMLHEDYTSIKLDDINKIEDDLFKKEIDIEHIQSYNDLDKNERANIWDEWGNEINSLGNLIVLERDKNRSIKNIVYGQKLLSYKDSCYSAVKKHCLDYPKDWSLDCSKKRKAYEVKQIMNYLFAEQ